MFSKYNNMKLEINYKKKTRQFKYMEIKEHADDQPKSLRRNQRRIKILETNENGNTALDEMKRVLKWKFTLITTSRNRKDLTQPHFTLTGTRKRTKVKCKVSRKKEIIKIRSEVNEIEAKKTIKKRSTKLRAGSEKINITNKCF